MTASPSVQSRSELMNLLTEACELEHGLACSYLFSAFTVKQSVYEGGISAPQFLSIRKWAGQLYFIASQEMLHLSQAWNLLSAIGGAPYPLRPNFPQSHRYYPLDLPLKLEPFTKKALRRFTFYELPSVVSDEEFLEKNFHISREKIDKRFTVGKLYSTILDAIENIPEEKLFIGDPALQVGPDTIHFNEIVKVTGRDSARRAIQTIMEQGEGNPKDEVDCHYGLFVEMDKEFEKMEEEAKANGTPFIPWRNTIENPIVARERAQGPAGSNPITNPYTCEVADLFDQVYGLMLRMLQYVFQSGPLPDQLQPRLGDMAIQLMTRALKPIGESLTLLPAGKDGQYEGKTAGPCFGLYRPLSFPAGAAASIALIREQLNELIAKAVELSGDPKAPEVLKNGADKLQSILTFL